MNASDVAPMPSLFATSRPTTSARTLEVIIAIGYGLMSFLSLALIAHLRHNRSDALKGNSSAARRVILPAFEPLLWILGATTGAFSTAMFIILALEIYDSGLPKLAAECFYCGRQFVFLLVMVFMHQKSVSLPALRRCVLVSLGLSTYTLPFVVYTTTWGTDSHADMYFQINRGLRLLLVAWYVYIFVYPPSRASKRSLREFCGFTFVYHAFSLIGNELFRSGYARVGYTISNCAVLWAALCPLVVWRVLRADTEHWRGVGQRGVFRQNHQIHEHISSQGLHVLIEMHRKLLIDFAYLELCAKIGKGASAVVYRGLLHSRTPVATKVYTPLALTDDVVASFSREAALCGTLHHPNVVAFYGMCVCPPTICLVFELCQGSLESVLLANDARADCNANRQRLSIAVGYMLDAARAVAYLHSFQPSFLHRDIKPANFLVDSDHNVKLADFGESRSIGVHAWDLSNSGSAPIQRERDDTVVIVPSPTELEMCELGMRAMTVKGTVDYMAPEVINGKGGLACYGEAADVYSLAMTMWDVLHPGAERFPSCASNHLQVFQAVLDGKRPTMDGGIHPMLRDLIARAWHVDPRCRPTAQDVVSVLEIVQEEVCAAFLLESFEDFSIENAALPVCDDDSDQSREENREPVARNRPAVNGGTFSGVEAVEHLLAGQYVANIGEALRMGRMWLDAGFLHHARHARGFTYDAARFYLDEDSIRLCQPMPVDSGVEWNGTRTMGAQAASQPPSPVGDSHTHAVPVWGSVPQRRRVTSETSTSAGRRPTCACRQYGRRQDYTVKPRRRQRFTRGQKSGHANKASMLTASLLSLDGTSASGSEIPFAGFESPCSTNANATYE